jgi:hypothetical protein
MKALRNHCGDAGNKSVRIKQVEVLRKNVQYKNERTISWRSFSRTRSSYCSLGTRTMTKLFSSIDILEACSRKCSTQLGDYQEFTSGVLQPGL